MKRFALLLVVVGILSTVSPAQEGTGIALWKCGPGGENLQVRIVNFGYMLTLNAFAADVSPKELGGLTRNASAQLCSEGNECLSANASVHYIRSDKHQIEGDFSITLPDGKVRRDRFKVRAYVAKPCM